ncbi:N-acetylmuramoyl-L-alanine amidase [Bacillus sp. 2205SS5-2]|uniref:N-acetylmuramoyl-L-alanine amidase n=1 Tax=Bacillus sp. 2205SS5-2 TaxID=3109031 RepID=UPI0030066AE4
MNKFKHLLTAIVSVALFLIVPSIISAEKNVVIDPGHGGWDSGTSGYSGKTSGFYEKHANLAISLKLKEKLESEGFNVFMTRTNNDTYLSLEDRVELANNFIKGKNDQSVFVSVHHNSVPTNIYVNGFESYYYDKSAAWDAQWPPDPIQVGYVNESKRLANSVHPSVINLLKLNDKGVRNYEPFYVIRNTQMPSVLVEMGFMSNPTEEALIKTNSFQTNAAEALKRGVVDYFKVFEVYSTSNEHLKTFSTEEEAVKYSKTKNNTYVFDKFQQKKVFFNTKEYSVFQKSNDEVKTFFDKEEAITYAESVEDSRVVDLELDSILWSNYLPKKYSVQRETGTTLNSFYDLNTAILYAQEKEYPTKIMDIDLVDVLWTNISGLKVTREIKETALVGDDRIQTAIKVSQKLYPEGFKSDKKKKIVVLTTAYQFADALSVGPLAAQLDNAPILLTNESYLNSEVEQEIKRLDADSITIIGGNKAISQDTEKKLENMGLDVTRLGAKDRYQTNILINEQLEEVEGVFIASGTNFADALGVAPIAAANNWAILLTDKNHMNEDALKFISGKQVKVLGGESAISASVEKAIKQQIGSTKVERLAGKDRYQTLATILREFSSVLDSSQLAVSTGTNFPDALTASALSVKSGSLLILVGNEINPHIYDFILDYRPTNNVSEVIKVGGIVDQHIIEKMKNVLY